MGLCFSSSGLGEFDSMTSRQSMIALYMIANDENIFDQIQKNEVELVDSHIRIESDIHDPVDTHISSEKNESITASAETAWSKAGMTGSFTSEDYVFYLNDSEATPDEIISGSTNDILIIDNDVTTRAAFENLYLIGEMNNSQTVTLRNRETNEPLSGVIITINGDYVGYDFDMNPVTTDENGQLTIPADKLLAAGTYHISTSSSGISKDRCTIIVNQGTHDTKYVSVRVEGINENILDEKQIVVTTTGKGS